MIETVSPEVSAFLDAFDQLRAAKTADAAGLFHATFLVLDPSTTAALSPAVLASALPARERMFESAGVRSVRRTKAHEQRLDALHSLVSVEWTAEREMGAALALSSTFVLRKTEAGVRVVVDLNHDDVRALLDGRSS